MAEAAVTPTPKATPKPMPSAPVANLSTRREQSLRAALVKKFGPSALKTMGYGDYDRLAIGVPAEWGFNDCLAPISWANVASLVAEDAQKTRKSWIGSIVELHHPKFYAEVIIKAIAVDRFGGPNGLSVACVGPAQDMKTGLACPRNIETGLPWADPAPEGEVK